VPHLKSVPVPAVASVDAATEAYLTAEEVSVRLCVTPGTIHDWASRKTNALPAKRITNKIVRFYWSEVQAWVEAGGTLRRKKVA